MPILVRKIERAKWENSDNENRDFPADAITVCMRTSQNRLSVWRILSDEEIEKAVIAIVSSGKHIDSIDVVLLDEEYFKENNIDLLESRGITSYEEMEDSHIDIDNLTYQKLGLVAYHISDKISTARSFRFRKSQLLEILWRAVQKEDLLINNLNENLRDKLLEKYGQ